MCELDPIACARLVRKAVEDSLYPPRLNSYHPAECKRTRKNNIDFAINSKLLHHFCDIFDVDYTKIQRAIINNNKL